MWRSPVLLLVVAGLVSCAPRREATVPLAPPDALARAARILESFEYNVVEIDRDDGIVRGTRTAEHLAPSVAGRRAGMPADSRDVVWQVTVHVTPAENGARYRLESEAASGADRLEEVDPRHLDRILAALADWKR